MVRTPRRSPAPDTLLRNKARWTDRWKAIRPTGRGNWCTDAATKVLKTALRSLAHGKCVYCESVLDERTEPEIEHYVAKTVDPDRAFEWLNLFPACGPCNRAKGDRDHHGQLLKPDDEDPEPYLWINEATGELEPMPGLNARETERALGRLRSAG